MPGISFQLEGLACVEWVSELSTDSANAEFQSVRAHNPLQEGGGMANNPGGHKGRGSGCASSDLAVEIRRIIQELDADYYPEDELPQPESQQSDDEMQSESPDLSTTIHSLKRELEDATTEAVIAIRLLHELVQLRHSELLDQLAQMEQNLQDEISLMERRIRGDVAMLRTERRRSIDSDFERLVEDDPDFEERDFGH